MGNKTFIFQNGSQYIDTQIININLSAPTDEDKGSKAVVSSMKPFEEAIPEYLRTGRLYGAWVKLRDDGILGADFRLNPQVSKVAARLLVTYFCAEGENQWKIFEEFWGIENLKGRKGTCSKTYEEKFSAIFSKL